MATTMLLPTLIDLRDGNSDWIVFSQSACITYMVAIMILAATRGYSVKFSARVGFLLTFCLWATASFIGALPLYFSHLDVSFAQAVFESVSGITTTGATALVGLDEMPKGILMWRSLLCWIGGIGFIALALLLLPSLRVGGVQLIQMESFDRSEKVLPRVNQVASAILIAYIGLSLVCMVSYLVAGMGMFDAINHGMTTIATAGFSTHDASFAYFNGNTSIFVIASLFMVSASIPFVFYVKMVLSGQTARFSDPQVYLFLSMLVVFIFSLTIGLYLYDGRSLNESFVSSMFHLVSIITTTGFTAEDYLLWGSFAQGIFFLVYFTGACAGSTSGGIKLNRIIILWQLMRSTLTRLISPNAVLKIRYGKTEIQRDILAMVLMFICLYVVTLVLGTVLLTMLGLGLVEAFGGALSALSNVGPGFGNVIGPVGNFSTIHDPALWLLSFLMLAGRLEIVVIVILVLPAFWRK